MAAISTPSERKKHSAGARTLLLLLALVTIAGAIVAVTVIQNTRDFTTSTPFAHITNYEECVAAGFPALKSYPGQCVLPNGTRFVQVIILDETINSFTACVAAGNPIMESAPPKCRTSDGRTFTATPDEWPPKREVRSFESCVANGGIVGESAPRKCQLADGRTFIELPEGYTNTTECQIDTDCKLINEDLGFACCYAGACAQTDYSESNWIAVNASRFDALRALTCPAQDACGPAPLCAVYIEPSGYTAKCIQNTCTKILENKVLDTTIATIGSGNETRHYYANITNSNDCHLAGGIFFTPGIFVAQDDKCYLDYTDVGTTCTSNAQCQGYCNAIPNETGPINVTHSPFGDAVTVRFDAQGVCGNVAGTFCGWHWENGTPTYGDCSAI